VKLGGTLLLPLLPPQLTLTITLVVALPKALVAVTVKVCAVPPKRGLPVKEISPLLLIVKVEVGVVGLMANVTPTGLVRVTLPTGDPAVQLVALKLNEG
jgi:hypothetical protein